jgi:phenylalanyl-tRNA synthetase alpha chain
MDTLESLPEQARLEAASISSRGEFDAFKARFVGPNGALTNLMKGIATLPKEEKPAFGKRVNETKTALNTIFEDTLKRIAAAEISASLGAPVDPSLPSPDFPRGGLHPLTLVRDEVCRIFHSLGFVIREGTEVETEYYCFDALNTPPDHPARDAHDTYYFPETARFGSTARKDKERYLLRTHTSSVQIRTMLAQPPPVRIVSPGRVFRRDNADATHSANFHQIEGLVVDSNITVRDLKATLDHFFRQLLGKETKVRFRPHYFGYTEPSFEVDFSASHLAKVGKEWVEIMGCGMVDPAVFEEVGYDPEKWSGFAFGLGIERIAMILYGIDDIRLFYQNDGRFLRQFR